MIRLNVMFGIQYKFMRKKKHNILIVNSLEIGLHSFRAGTMRKIHFFVCLFLMAFERDNSVEKKKPFSHFTNIINKKSVKLDSEYVTNV